ncbi:hypothetical protein [Polaromonas hydrogenivorans]|uniref:DUF3885 domain-containing protein n=1 Tax=Polaromonas hydrogenivorans TaxID=335476 RepID=A0AAU7LQK6_9BURK
MLESKISIFQEQKYPLTWWCTEFGKTAPVGHALRQFLPLNWTRFHSLPESKRYPESEDEYLEIIRRNAMVASELFQIDEPIYVYKSYYRYEKKLRGKSRHQVAGRQLREDVSQLFINVGRSHQDEDNQCSVRALVTKWKPDFFERLIRQVAVFDEAGVSLVSPATKNIFCPYDGGMDIFTFSLNPAELENKFHSWLSVNSNKM